MAKIKAEYMSGGGYYIIRINDGLYYYGNGDTTNALGKSANQFLRFNPYMEYVGDRTPPIDAKVAQWIEENATEVDQ